MNEQWKDVAGYDGYYQVSSYGRIKSVERYIQQIAEALGMTVDIIDPGLQDLAPLKQLTP